MNPFVQSLLISDQTTGSDSSGDLGETINQSLRFRQSEVAFLSRTPGSEGSRTTWTYSFWYKPGSRTRAAGETGAGTVNFLSVNPSETNTTYAEFLIESDRMTFQGATVTWVMPNRRLRDNSGWYHFVLVCDTNNGTAADRIRVYINGDRITDFQINDQAGSGDELGINNTVEHTIGKRQGTTQIPVDGLLAEVNFLDGTAIGDTNGVINEFGRYNEFGVWVPKSVGDLTSNQYGLNGYRLEFNSETGVGNDTAPTGGTHASANNWTLNNFDEGDVILRSKDLFTSTNSSININSTDKAFDTTSFPPVNAFDNDTTSQCTTAAATNTAIIYRPETAITSVTQIEIFAHPTASVASYIGGFNGTSNETSIPNSGFQEIYNGTAITVNNIYIRSSDQAALTAIRINGSTVLRDNNNNDVEFFDTPTRNYAVNSLIINNDRPTITSGNLQATGLNNGLMWATQKLPNKHIYAEFIKYDADADRFAAGVGNANNGFERGSASDNDYAFMICYSEFGGNNSIFNQNTTATQTGLTDYPRGAVLGVEWRGDLATRQVNFYINGTQVGNSENVAAGDDYYFAVQRAGGSNSPEVLANFGQMPYLAAPAGVTNTSHGMQTNNMPTPTIRNGKDHFEAKLYEGTGVANTITGMGFAPDLIWIKGITTTDNHVLVDTIRGTDSVIFSNSDDQAASSNSRFTSFNNDGFEVDTNDGSWNQDEQNYVAWCWKAGGSTTTTNDTGTIDSEVSANTTAGFSIITWTGTGSDGSYGHGLTSAPEFILHKRLNGSSDWHCYHEAIGGSPANDVLFLNTDAVANTGNDNVFRQNPSSSLIFTGDANSHNVLNATYVDYAWHSVPGFSKFGGYTGNDNADGIYIETGFKPALIIIKGRGQGWSWFMWDHMRNISNPANQILKADLTQNQADASSTAIVIDFLSNGFKLRNAGGHNQATTYVYCAWAQNPFGGEDTPPMTAR